jgi:hypothetical protein
MDTMKRQNKKLASHRVYGDKWCKYPACCTLVVYITAHLALSCSHIP